MPVSVHTGTPPTPLPLLSEYLSEPDTAKELGVCTRTLGRMRERGGGPPYVRIAKRVVYRREAIADWLRKQETK
ncbi:helix-turn-helix transcriptional regulator [Azospirillum argentinense]|uniref:Helix-turn-helix domain-containing protein n=1 Tax=Azospirillum argentinense TaxID=2970906 RepID=A0A5B0KT56_9PROT|nr:helix-turn-helix domain-containing protein [Azospirillum argentinense]KAA1054688.1 hypothetical protein FH063_005964 [Azospirillum argentinense]